MKTKEYFFDGNTYVCRIVQANDGEELIIAPTALLDVIQPGSFEDENEGFANKEAEYIYDEIFSSLMRKLLLYQRSSLSKN